MDGLEKELIGKSVEEFSISEVGYCQLTLSQGWSIAFECLGRFVKREGGFFTTEDHSVQFGLPVPFDAVAELGNAINKKEVQGAEWRPGTGDLILSFESGRLELICNSLGYEAYEIGGPDGQWVVQQGGG